MKEAHEHGESPYTKLMGFEFNINLGKNLELLRNAVIYQDFDAVILIDGKEGSGKSVLAMQIGKFLSKDRRITVKKNLVWVPEEFKTKVLAAKKHDVIVWDEARRGLNRRRSTQDVNMVIVDLLAEIRQKNLFIIVVMPSFYDMDLNIAVHRSRCLIHTWYDFKGDNPSNPLRRGFFRFYNEESKTALYTNKESRTGYMYPYFRGGSFDGTFSNHYVVNEKEYKKLKKESMQDYQKEKKEAGACPVCHSREYKYLVKKKINRCRHGHTWEPKNDLKRGGE